MGSRELMQIGEVAERTGLSLRTIRYYEEVGIVVPSARSQGGFRLYTQADVNRLLVVKRMKPVELTLDQIRELLEILDRLAAAGESLGRTERVTLQTKLREFQATARAREAVLETQLCMIREFADDLSIHLDDVPTGAGRRAVAG
ncbi:DNA-binding transcriptional MerR regulator [Micromonospora sp. Llam0]|uniref:MerR family transcriptional regulator n=1 Tax=Micromonospora sp. Llam0 TaxID=2485143 RepID=UPI000F4A0B28|nr:MerR family transcriptional regulator [Micromonospora sp. Llam0]ROO60747.1 DNA-binding transcriptional MerR regulator [Micromonospora sp. Llam0]